MSSQSPEKTALGKYRVIDLADQSGLHCTKILADLGADVIKVERPGGDASRNIPPFVADTPHPDKSIPFLYLNTNKRGITLNLESGVGKDLLKRLVKSADVLVETFPVGHMSKLGLGYEALSQINPGLVLTSITPFGQTGPFKDFKGCDMVAWAMGGMMYVCGELEFPPVMGAGYQAYMFGSLSAAMSTMFALYYSDATGEGQHVDISLQEAVACLLPEMGVTRYLEERRPQQRYGTHRPGIVPLGCFPCKDGYAQIIVAMPHHWDIFAKWISEATGNDSILDPMFKGGPLSRADYQDLIHVYINDLTKKRTKSELTEEGQAYKLCITSVDTPEDLSKDKHLHDRGYFVEVEHPEAGKLVYPGAPYKLSESPWSIRRPAPRIGEHNEEIFIRELGLTKKQLVNLAAEGVI